MESSIITCANPSCPLGATDNQDHQSCKGCLLVKYCGRDCQVQHWGEHKKYCKSPFMKPDWKPNWGTTGRKPAFVGDHNRPLQTPFGGNKYLWGNVPAIDVLQLAKNEGGSYNHDVHLLFAASGDLRNVVKTVSSTPDTFQKSLSIVLNDRDAEIVIRNAILLLVSLSAEETKEAIDCMIHIWYSAFIQSNHLSILQGKLRVLVADIIQKIANKPLKSLQAKSWSFGSRTLRLVLAKEVWCKLLERLDVPISLTAQKAHQIRTAITLAPSRRDYRERRYMYGLLLPFGISRARFDTPNPSVDPFESNQSWQLQDSLDPLDGWDIFDILNETPRAAASDVYGKLYFYLQHILKEFIEKSISLNISFQLLNVDAEELSEHLEREKFSRIEVSNICDAGYLGYEKTLFFLGPLLQKQSTNSHATLIMLFMNAIKENLTHADELEAFRSSTPQLAKFLPPAVFGANLYEPMYLKYILAADLFHDKDRFFNKFEECGHLTGMVMKGNAIVERWPMRLRKKAGQPGAKEEFDLLFGSGHGNERYVEWQTVD
ncbi:hypothetical protein ACQKWADRAFT_324100 [Trichoderma austrokoningii]